jgi:retron-type reverse transcriptase
LATTNQGAAGVDGASIEEFEKDLKGNLYRIWDRMSSGSYFPPPVRFVEIPKGAGGSRVLEVPTVADRIAQTVAKIYLEAYVEPIFHTGSYGYQLAVNGHRNLHAYEQHLRVLCQQGSGPTHPQH